MGSVIICHRKFQTSNIVYRPYPPYRSEGIFQFLERKKKKKILGLKVHQNLPGNATE